MNSTVSSTANSPARADARAQRVGLGSFGAAVLTAWCVLVAAWPLTHVIVPGRWGGESVLLVVALLLTGLLVRWWSRLRALWLRTVLTLLAQCSVLVALFIQTSFADSATAGLFPNLTVFREIVSTLQTAGEQVRNGAAPLAATPEIVFSLSVSISALALVLEALIVVARLPLAAAVLVGAVGIVPTVIVPGDVNTVWFVLLAMTVFILLRTQVGAIGATEMPRPRWATTAFVAVAALLATVVIAPGLPVAATGFGSGLMTLDPSLRLGEDLRRPTVTDVMTLITDAERAPYLRVATLSRFDGEIWLADDSSTMPLGSGFSLPDWQEDVQTSPQLTSVRVLGLSSSWLPLPYAATAVRGLEGSWRVMTANHTVLSSGSDAAGQTYSVDSVSVQPTADQARLATASGSAGADYLRALPEVIPESIRQTAREITASAQNDYDRLIAIQTWFRSQFRYSLDTPVEEGFDGTGVEAIEKFLDTRAGYCVHFAGAFAVMARSLGIPTRIVVGYLPGTRSDDEKDGAPIYRVASDQLHSWPEVYFEGLGWIPFEPTATLGVPTRFAAANVANSANIDVTDSSDATLDDAPVSEAPSDDRRDEEVGAVGSSATTLDPSPFVIGTLALVVLVLVPAAARLTRRMRRGHAVREGDAEAAWTELRDTLLDLGYPASAAESPRQRGERLVRQYRVDADATLVLVTSIERQRFDRPSAQAIDGEALAAALQTVRSKITRRADARARIEAVLIPRSLLGRRITERAAT